ncbi:hypothetical protein BEWA_046630 [Theileria equi strain WA]|uniref:Uncharacterized protein n=1 Tax=Theileria equi strain WA TaxID=1537102 RepID=L1LAB8_THEEQ|nr:hypothetical protein BEWA_046630 [Theileria equi strain WA]EKX72199.1 hypothetical protein BEWA_046630 [Theileria equi strain WA]|eukprot:XP_004831651.1 hypothetical protein BEWA_046630 [Theileria equi strain WA]
MVQVNTVDVDIYRGYQGDKIIQQYRQKCYISGNGRVNIDIESRPNLIYYRVITHTPEGGHSIETIKSTHCLTNFSPPPSNKTSVTVFYSLSDPTHETPLIVEFGDLKNEYYTTEDGNKWTKARNITVEHLKKHLDEQNCKRRNFHVIDISKKSSASDYKCPGCNEQVSVSSFSPTSGYTYYTHSIRDYYIGELRYNTEDQTGLTCSSMITKVHVYWYKDDEKPLLICLSGGNSFWYKREALSSKAWTEVSKDRPSSISDEPNILRILLGYHSPEVTINVGYRNGLDRSGKSSTYRDNSETISIRRDDVMVGNKSTGYIGFTHSVSGKSWFKVREIKHGETQLTSIKLPCIFTSVEVYYHGKDPSDEKKLLLIGLEKMNGQNKHVYYSRPLVTGGTWAMEEHSIQLEQNKLRQMLDALKMAHFPESPTTTIVGSSVGSGLGGAGLGALAVWKGPSLLARLITKAL